MIWLRRAVVLLACLSAAAPNAAAFDFTCSQFRGHSYLTHQLVRPEPPSCLDTLYISMDDFSFKMCRSDMESYRRQVEDYLQCLHDEGGEAVNELNSAVDKFNCYACGGSVCP